MIYFSRWYYNSSLNDLDYWGIDYPPLSAWHSYGLGRAFKIILPEAVKIKTSRGYESSLLTFLMRMSVSLSDLLVPALILFHVMFFNPEKKLAPWVCSEYNFYPIQNFNYIQIIISFSLRNNCFSVIF